MDGLMCFDVGNSGFTRLSYYTPMTCGNLRSSSLIFMSPETSLQAILFPRGTLSNQKLLVGILS